MGRGALHVVIEEAPHVFAFAAPSAEVARPGGERRVGVVAMVAPGWSMSADVDPARRDLPGGGRGGVIGQAQRGVVLAQQFEDRLRVPARMAELEGVAPGWVQHLEEGSEALPVYLHLGRELKKNRTDLVAQDFEARLQKLQGVVAALGKLLPMGDELRGLPSEAEIVRRLIEPALHGLQRRRAVEGRVELGRVEAGHVIAERPSSSSPPGRTAPTMSRNASPRCRCAAPAGWPGCEASRRLWAPASLRWNARPVLKTAAPQQNGLGLVS